jgi:hypothetical protein
MEKIRKRTKKVQEDTHPLHTGTAIWSNPEAEMKNRPRPQTQQNFCVYKNNYFEAKKLKKNKCHTWHQ